MPARRLAYAKATFSRGSTASSVSSATEVAVKLGNEHKLRAERSQLLVCAAPSCPADIRKDCSNRVEQVNAQIPSPPSRPCGARPCLRQASAPCDHPAPLRDGANHASVDS